MAPLFADQPYNAERVAGLGAGLTADWQRPETIRAGVERLLAEPSFRMAAAGVAREAFALPPIEAAESALRELVLAARVRRAA